MNCELGMVGLGVMGRNLLLNLADHGISVAGYDLDVQKVESLKGVNPLVASAKELKDFIGLLRKPRVVMMLIPAGPPVDGAIQSLLPFLEKGDILIDGGNSFYKDTDKRSKNLAEKGVHFFGLGISGGESGARHGPSIMSGGQKESYARIQPIFEAAAAKVDGDPCTAYLGPGSAGHFVKMVHNGIEYGLMQIISETYDMMKRGLDMSASDIRAVYTHWNNTELNSYLMEITSKIFAVVDEKTSKPLIDTILDVAKQKGTGMWTSQSGMEFQVPIPTIDLAVAMRDMSMEEDQRKRAQATLQRPIFQFKENREILIEEMREAFYVAMIVIYAQGFALLNTASKKLGYGLDLETVAKIWRGGCIIRAALLENIRNAYTKDKELPNLLLDPGLSKKVMHYEESLRHVICASTEIGIPAPAFMASLGYIDSYRSAWLPANLIQAQRDFFGSHMYERIDEQGTFHTSWEKEKS